MNSETKTIQYRGGIVQFRLPAHWQEDYDPQGGGTFYEDRADSGTLRLEVLTANLREGELFERAIERACSVGDFELLASGLRMRRRTIASEEQGTAIHLHRWEIAVPVPPNQLRVVCFTHTILASQETHRAIAEELAFIGKSIRDAEFSREPGISGDYHHARRT